MRVIIDCDPGNGIPAADIDDGLAIGLALASPEVELEAITVVAGNTPRDDGVSIACTMLSRVGVDVPVYAGAVTPLVEDPYPWRSVMDARRDQPLAAELWKDVERPSTDLTPAGGDAVDQLVERISAAPGEITLFAVGPLTNVAQALGRRPELAREVKRIVIMGGAFAVPNLLQELNFGYDPEAARKVLTSGAPVTVVPFDVTRLTTLLPEHVERLAGAGTPLATYLADTCRPWVRWIQQARELAGCHLHDPLAVASILAPELVTSHRQLVDVELRGTLTRARPIGWDPGNDGHANGLRLPDLEPIDVVTDVDNDAFVEFLLSRLEA